MCRKINSCLKLAEPVERKAFTLIELLVVMTIILILAALIAPAVSATYQQSLETVCQSRLGQIGMIWRMYTMDHDDAAMPADLQGGIDSWLNYVANDCGSSAMIQCPAMPEDERFDPFGGIGEFAQSGKASYIMNVIRKNPAAWTGAGLPETDSISGWGDGTTEPAPLAIIVSPSSKILISDAIEGISSADARGILRFLESDYGSLIDRDVGYHHSDGFNALYGDGHVEWKSTTENDEWNAAHW